MPRHLRADARANRDRLLEVAGEAFARDGASASLKAIAAEAGVGIGTLYRRFPTRADLVEATCRNETIRLADSAPELLKDHAPRAALRLWMARFVDFTLTKQHMYEALPAILSTREGLRMHSRQALGAAVEELLDAGIAAGEIRADVRPADVLMALGGIAMISGREREDGLVARLIDLLLDGLDPLCRRP